MNTTQETAKGVKGFELDIHVSFVTPREEAEAKAQLLVLEGLLVELYRPHPQSMPGGHVGTLIPSARLTGPLHDAQKVRQGLAILLSEHARYIEVGLRGFLRSGEGQTEWMPWRKTVVYSKEESQKIEFEQGFRYVLE